MKGMKGKVAALAAGVIIGGASTAGAATIITKTVTSHGVVCGFGRGDTGEGVGCGLVKTRKGQLGVSLTNREAIIWQGKRKLVVKLQP